MATIAGHSRWKLAGSLRNPQTKKPRTEKSGASNTGRASCACLAQAQRRIARWGPPAGRPQAERTRRGAARDPNGVMMRAARRTLELRQRGDTANEADVLADILRRDERDTKRAAAPLKPAPDAYLLDTTHLGIDAAFRAAVDIIEAARAGRKRG